MIKMNNALTFSFSRVRLLYTCLRCYYFSYYASNNGWRQDAALRTKLIYRLKKLQPLNALVGESIHRSIKEIILNPDLGIIDFKRSINRKIKDMYRKSLSQKDQWIENPRLFTMIHEIYYDSEISLEVQQKVIDKIDNCSNNLKKSKSYAELIDNDSILSIDDLAEVQFDGFKTFVKVDALYEKEGRLVIIDWKTGNPSESDLEQELLYAYFVSKLYNVSIEQVEARLEYLCDGDCTVYNFNHKDMEFAEEILRNGIADIQSCLSNSEKGLPYPEAYYRQNKSSKCRFCNYREICFGGTFPSKDNSEQQKSTALILV